MIGPEWLDTARFDIAAKSPEGVPDTEMAPMLEALLRERFHLQAHLETRTVPSYHLLVAPGGVKMPLSPQPDLPEFGPPDIFTAIQKQLGLELESGKDAVSVLIVDRIERSLTGN